MPSVDFTAVRDGADGPPGSAPPFPGGAEHLVAANRRAPRAVRLRALVPGVAVAIVVHIALTFAGLAIWRAMLHDLNAPEPISVEIVHSVPGEDDKPGEPPKPPQPEAKAAPPDAKPADPQPSPPQAAAEPAPPNRSVLDDALPPPAAATPPAAPAPSPAVTPTPEARPASPAPSERTSNALGPPPEQKAAATQPETVPAATASATPTTPPPPPAKLASVPSVVAARDSDTSVPPPRPEPDPAARTTAPAPDDTPPKPDPNAALAAALPQSPLATLSTFRAVLAAQQDVNDNTACKAAVYGNLNRGKTREIDEQARRRGLRGNPVVRFSLTNAGAIQELSIVESGGNAAVDEAAKALARGGAPYPACPPGAQRVFTIRLPFGD